MDWIRQLSNVNCIFRQEIAEVFWRRIKLSISEICLQTSFVLLRYFVQNRPAAMGGIKSLHLVLEDVLGLQISECQDISKLLCLEELYLDIFCRKMSFQI
jgi:hypothetical protein